MTTIESITIANKQIILISSDGSTQKATLQQTITATVGQPSVKLICDISIDKEDPSFLGSESIKTADFALMNKFMSMASVKSWEPLGSNERLVFFK